MFDNDVHRLLRHQSLRRIWRKLEACWDLQLDTRLQREEPEALYSWNVETKKRFGALSCMHACLVRSG